MTSFVPPKKNDANGLILYVALLDASTPGSYKSSPTLAAGDVKISKDGGALANLGTLPVVTPASSIWVKITLSQSETNADNVAIQFIDQTSPKEWTDLGINFQTSTRQVDDLAYPATTGRSMVVDASGLVDANVVKVGPTGSGTAQTAGDIMADTNDIQTRLPAALVSGRMDSSVGAMAAGVLTATAIAADAITPAKIQSLGIGTVTTGATTTSVPTSAFSPAGAIADQFKNRTILFDDTTTTTTLRGCARQITASSNAATPTLTVDALPAAPASGDTFSVI
jgi:hypothetical protein